MSRERTNVDAVNTRVKTNTEVVSSSSQILFLLLPVWLGTELLLLVEEVGRIRPSISEGNIDEDLPTPAE